MYQKPKNKTILFLHLYIENPNRMGSTNTKEEVILAQNAAGAANQAAQLEEPGFHYKTALITLGMIVILLIIAYYVRKYLNKKITREVQKSISNINNV